MPSGRGHGRWATTSTPTGPSASAASRARAAAGAGARRRRAVRPGARRCRAAAARRRAAVARTSARTSSSTVLPVPAGPTTSNRPSRSAGGGGVTHRTGGGRPTTRPARRRGRGGAWRGCSRPSSDVGGRRAVLIFGMGRSDVSKRRRAARNPGLAVPKPGTHRVRTRTTADPDPRPKPGAPRAETRDSPCPNAGLDRAEPGTHRVGGQPAGRSARLAGVPPVPRRRCQASPAPDRRSARLGAAGGDQRVDRTVGVAAVARSVGGPGPATTCAPSSPLTSSAPVAAWNRRAAASVPSSKTPSAPPRWRARHGGGTAPPSRPVRGRRAAAAADDALTHGVHPLPATRHLRPQPGEQYVEVVAGQAVSKSRGPYSSVAGCRTHAIQAQSRRSGPRAGGGSTVE